MLSPGITLFFERDVHLSHRTRRSRPPPGDPPERQAGTREECGMTSRPSPSSPPPDNATTRFGERASAYAAARPSYPAKVIDAVLDGLGDPRGLVGADVGAGTGVFSRLLARRGVRVIAVAPSAPMRDGGRRARDNAGLRIEWREGAGEATGLDARSMDLVTVAQAFHW